MSRTVPNPPPGFDDLSVDEQLDYVQSLWDHISAKPENVAVPDWHLQTIEQRLREGTGAGRDWQEIRDQLLSELKKSKPTR